MGHVNATKAGAGVPPGPKRGVGVRTVVGLPVIDPEAVRAAIDPAVARPKSVQPRAGLGGPRDDQTPVSLRTESDPESDTRYMDPPSEALGRARTEQMPEALRPTPRPPMPAMPDVEMRGGVDMRGVDMRGSVDMRGLDVRGGVDMRGLSKSTSRPRAGEELAARDPYAGHAVHDAHGAQDAASGRRSNGPVPRTRVDMLSDRSDAPLGAGARFESGAEPQAFRNDVRRALRNAPTSDIGDLGHRRAQPAAGQGLRLKLDVDTQDIRYGAGRKSALPRALTWLCVLGALGGGAAYYIDTHGGLPALMANVDSLRDGAPVQNPPPPAADTTPTAPAPAPAPAPAAQTAPPSAAAAANPAQPATPGEHAPVPGGSTTPPNGAEHDVQAAQPGPHEDHEAAPAAPENAPTTPGAAEPSGASAEAPSPATHEAQEPAAAASESHRSKPAEAPKPKARPAPKAKPAPARPAVPRRQDPVIQVRPLGDDTMLPPPEPPSAGPSLPLDPPAPDER